VLRASLVSSVAPVAFLLAAVPAARAQQDDWYYRQLLPSLPQQLNGIIRPVPGKKAPERLERVRDVFTLMRTCWRQAPRVLSNSGQEMTLRMSFNRRGEVIGKPQITFYRPGADPDARDPFVNSIQTAFQQCTPLPFSESLGAVIAGRPFTFRFVDSRAPQRSL
jgi:hypothetical protein